MDRRSLPIVVGRLLLRTVAALALLAGLAYAYALITSANSRFWVTTALLVGGVLIVAINLGSSSAFGKRDTRNRPISDQSPRSFSWVLTGLCVFCAGIVAAVWLPATHDSHGSGRCIDVVTANGRHWHVYSPSTKLLAGPCSRGPSIEHG